MRFVYYLLGLYLLKAAITGRSTMLERLVGFPEIAAMNPSQRIAYLEQVTPPPTKEEITEQYVHGALDFDAFIIAIDEAIRREFDAA